MIFFTRKLLNFAETNLEQGIPDSDAVSRYIQSRSACLLNLIMQIVYHQRQWGIAKQFQKILTKQGFEFYKAAQKAYVNYLMSPHLQQLHMRFSYHKIIRKRSNNKLW